MFLVIFKSFEENIIFVKKENIQESPGLNIKDKIKMAALFVGERELEFQTKKKFRKKYKMLIV